MGDKISAEEIVGQMLREDAFSKWLGIEVLETAPGYSCIQMVVRPEMVNGFGIGHGGITFSLPTVHLPLLQTVEAYTLFPLTRLFTTWLLYM